MRFANFIRLEIDRNVLSNKDLLRRFFIPASSRRAVAAGAEERFPEKGRKRGCAAGGRAHRMRPAAARRRRGGTDAGRDEEAGAAEPDAGRPCPESVIGVVLSVMELLCRGIRCVSLHRGTFRASGFPRPSQHAPLTAELSRRRGGRPKGAFRRAGCGDERKTGLRRGGK